MANTIINTSLITDEALMRLKRNLKVARAADIHWNKEFGNVGDTISIRKPVYVTSTTNSAFTTQNIVEQSVSLPLQTRGGVHFTVTSTELTLNIGNRMDRYVEAAMSKLAHDVDAALLGTAVACPNAVGTAGTTPTATTVLRDAMSKMDLLDMPRDNRFLFLDPLAYGNIMEVMKDKFTPNLNEDALKMGGIPGDIYGFNGGIQMAQGVVKTTSGTESLTTLTVTATSSNGDTTIGISTGGNAKTLVVGDRITINNVNSVDPVTKSSTGVQKQFVVTAINTSSAGGVYTAVAISPAIVSSGAYQNVDALPQITAPVQKVPAAASVLTTHNFAFVKSALVLATRPLAVPLGGALASTKIDPDTGLSVRCIMQYDNANDQNTVRFDILYQAKLIYPEMSMVVYG